MPASEATASSPKGPSGSPPRRSWARRLLVWTVGLILTAVFSVACLVAVAMVVAYPNLPDVSELAEYRPKLPLRIYTTEGDLIGEFGEERRKLTPIAEIPQIMKQAVLSIEDNRFYEHGGVDYWGMARASIKLLGSLGFQKSQGGSTITMQVARNVYLTTEKTYTRKIYEILLTYKLEHLLTKDQILEIYMNQIFLGNRSYGFASAAEIYFGKALKDLSIAEAAMLAGLPKAPSAYNPFSNPKRARARQLYIVERMEENGYITAAQAKAAKAETLRLRSASDPRRIHAEYLAETVRQMVYAQYGSEIYTQGMNVYTTVRSAEQQAAYRALRQGLLDYERRQVYRGPEKFIELPKDPKQLDEAIDDVWKSIPTMGNCWPPWCSKSLLARWWWSDKTANRSRSAAMDCGPCSPVWPKRHRQPSGCDAAPWCASH